MTDTLLVITVIAERAWACRHDVVEGIKSAVGMAALLAVFILLVVAYGTLGR